MAHTTQLQFGPLILPDGPVALIADHAVSQPPARLVYATSGERSKSLTSYCDCLNALVEGGLPPDGLVVGLGGGATLDLAGFVAATYCRGVGQLWLVPTTLLAMVDACVGGKNGVNVQGVKNAVGTIRHPDRVVIDTGYLATLPPHELQQGQVELLKHELLAGAIASTAIEERIKASIAIKQAIIARGVRDWLNLGHTVGHALELLEEGAMPHGQAVAIGLLVEAALAHRMGLLSAGRLEEVRAAVAAIGLPLTPSARYEATAWQAALAHDKKARDGQLRCVLLRDGDEPLVEAVDPLLLGELCARL